MTSSPSRSADQHSSSLMESNGGATEAMQRIWSQKRTMIPCDKTMRLCSLRAGRRWAINDKMPHEASYGAVILPVILGTAVPVQCTVPVRVKLGAISCPASRHVTGVARNTGVPGMLCTNQACSKASSSSAAALSCQIPALGN